MYGSFKAFCLGNKKVSVAAPTHKRATQKKPKAVSPSPEVVEYDVPHHKRGIFVHIQAIKTVPTTLFQYQVCGAN